MKAHLAKDILLNLILINTIFWVLFSLILGEVNTKYTFYVSLILAFYILLSKSFNSLNLFKINKEFIFYPLVIIILIIFYWKKIIELKTPSDLIMRNIAINTFRESNIASLTNQYKYPDGSLNNWYKLDTEFYPDAMHILIAQLGNLLGINNENLTLIMFLYGIFIIWPYLIFKILSYNQKLLHKDKVILTLLFGSFNIFPLSTFAWGGLPFLYGQLLALYLVYFYLNKYFPRIIPVLLSPFLFFNSSIWLVNIFTYYFYLISLKQKNNLFFIKN